MTAPHDETRTDRAIHVLPWISMVVLVAVFVTTIWVLVNSSSANESLAAQAQSDKVAQCSRRLRGPIDTADAQLGRASTDLSLLILSGLAAVANEDDAALAEIIAREPVVRLAVAKAQAAKDLAADAYDDAARLPVAQFLAECKARGTN